MQFRHLSSGSCALPQAQRCSRPAFTQSAKQPRGRSAQPPLVRSSTHSTHDLCFLTVSPACHRGRTARPVDATMSRGSHVQVAARVASKARRASVLGPYHAHWMPQLPLTLCPLSSRVSPHSRSHRQQEQAALGCMLREECTRWTSITAARQFVNKLTAHPKPDRRRSDQLDPQRGRVASTQGLGKSAASSLQACSVASTRRCPASSELPSASLI